MSQSLDDSLTRGEALLHEDLITPLHDHDEARNRLLAKIDGATRVVSPEQANSYATTVEPNLGIDEVEHDADGPKTGRRGLFKGTLIGLGGLLAASAMPRYSFAQTNGDLLICVFLRGGFDGLSAIGRPDDADYLKARKAMAVNDASKSKSLGGGFLLSPSLGALGPIWDAGQLAVVRASGHPKVSRSHFEDQAMCERAAAANVRSGWLGRHIATSSATSGTFRAITIGDRVVLSLTTTAHQSLAMSSVESFDLWSAWNGRDALVSDIAKLYGSAGGVIENQVKGTVDAVNALRTVRETKYTPANGAKYPKTSFGDGLKDIARLAKAGVGMEVACIDYDGWDLHQASGSPYQAKGAFSTMAADLASAIAALRTDLGSRWNSVTVVTMSEFGRRVAINGAGGTDHGHGNVQFIMGGSIRGGLYGEMPLLSSGNLVQGDVPILTDYRQALSEVVSKRLGNSKIDEVFPGFTPATALGVA
ncbi:MAG: Tat pathway signal protein [Actinobacteria bacterium HGW-Actinobacteria-2]|nr:MAG: Tat pathway signal protein [Actinobacteria bacterium HGW-Actinobacteria-2]